MEEKDKPDMEGGDVALVTTTENDYSTDEEMPSYSDDAAGMRKAYKDIQNIFAEVIRDYPEEFYPDEAEKKREEDAAAAAAGDAGVVSTEMVQEPPPPQEPLKSDKTILGLTPASMPNFLSATKSSVAHQREPVPQRPRTSKSGSKNPAAALKKLWGKKENESSKGNKIASSTQTKTDKKPNTVPLAPNKSKIKKQDLPSTVGDDAKKVKNTASSTDETQESIQASSQARVHFDERPSIKKVDLRPIDGAEYESPNPQTGSKIISRRTEPVPDLTDEAIATSSEMDEIVTYRMDTPLEALWPIKVVVRGSSLTNVESIVEDVDEGGDKLPVAKIEVEHGPVASETESGFSKVASLPSRVNTVLDNVPHDDFAAEFIKDAGIKSDRAIIESMTVEYRAPPPPPRETTVVAKSVSQNLSNRDVQTSLKLVYTPPVWPHHVPLYTALSKLPSLRSVVLDDSKIQWLRELGSSLPNLVTLSVMRCGLKSLDGVSAFPNLENFFVADNRIENPSQLSVLRNLRFLDLSDNPIDTFEGFAFLKLCTNLRCMKLMETEVAKYADFHTQMRRLIPSLRELQPKSVAIHGPEVYEMYNNQLSDDDEEDFLDETESVTNPFSALKPVAKTEEEQFKRIIHRSTGLKWREEERRLRESIYNPDRKLFRNRAAEGVGVPKNVDEMDAYLDDLESMSEAAKNPPPDPSRVLVSAFNAPQSGGAEASTSAGNLTSFSGYTDTNSGVGAEDTVSSRVTRSPSDALTAITAEEFREE